MLYEHNNIPSRAIDITFGHLIEALVIEINLKGKSGFLSALINHINP